MWIESRSGTFDGRRWCKRWDEDPVVCCGSYVCVCMKYRLEVSHSEVRLHDASLIDDGGSRAS